MPTAADLDDPMEFSERLGDTPSIEDDPIAQLTRETEKPEDAEDPE